MESWLSIGALSAATGVPTNTLRTWERRYGFPASKRKPSGHRLYSHESIPLILSVRRALALGHRPAEILGLSGKALEALIASAPIPSSVAPAQPHAGLPGPPALLPSARAVGRLAPDSDQLPVFASSFDSEGMKRRFREMWAELGPIRFLEGCAAPFLKALEAARQTEKLGLRHMRFASACLTDLLRELRRPYDARAQGPMVAATTFPGDQSEMGLLMAGLVCAIRGWRVIDLGVGLPSGELVKLAEELPIGAVAVTVSPSAPQAYVFALLLELRRTLPERTPLWVGGARAAPNAPGIVHYHDFDALDRQIAAAAAAATGHPSD